MKRLFKMLQYRRGHGSEGERVFTKKYIAPYAPTVFNAPNGETLAYVIEVKGLNPKTLFSCHVDTVHSRAEPSPILQKVIHDKASGLFYKDDGEPLGADDAAGIWIMLGMIDAGVAGTYIFHRGEEVGGVGSRGMVEHHKDFLSGFDYAIAFDRRGTSDIITTQGCGRCCSDEFAHALAGALNRVEALFTYRPDDTGIFTDTANYRRIIPECTNVSVGYENEHSKEEMLDAWHVEQLRDALIKAFKGGCVLPVARDKDAADVWDEDVWGGYKSNRSYPPAVDSQFVLAPRSAEEVTTMAFQDLAAWVQDANPVDVAEFIMELAEEAVRMESEKYN